MPRWSFVLLALAACASADKPAIDQATSAVAPASATVLVHYPTGWGHRITLHCGGEGRSWTDAIDAAFSDGDVWRVTLPAARALQCKPLFDDATWSMGPNFSVAPGQSLDIWPHFFHDRGKTQQIRGWHSNILGNDRRIWVYTPPSYDENARERYPVVYMHDGQNLFYDEESATGVSWNVGGAMDQGARDGTIHEAIVIGIDNTPDRIAEYTPVADPGSGGGNGDRYLAFIVDELKPQMDAQLRTFADARHTAIVGSSLGALISIYAAVRRPDVFGEAGGLSPATWWDNEWITGLSTAARAPLPLEVYIDSGDSGTASDDVGLTAKLADAWKAKGGVAVDYRVQHGASHSEVYWRQRIAGALAFLLGPR
jgi:predicted alpha/beta superfamily hydrolase